MSSDPPSDAPSSAPEHGSEADLGLAALVRTRGAPLIDAVDEHSRGAREHAEATASYAFAAAVELGYERGRCEAIREAAKLHETGKVYVPAAILARSFESLDAAERAQLESHFESGASLARGAGIPDEVCGWLLRVRERFDGQGPEGLRAVQIPIESRLIHAACACDALLARPWDGASGGDRYRMAADELRRGARSEFDPRVIEALAAILQRAATG